jgi:hypothetical protein
MPSETAMLYRRKLDRLLLIIVPAAVIVYASTRPQVRLRVEMPPEFVDLSPSMSSKKETAERKLAEQYWTCVLTNIQWKYTYGSPLPDVPPEDFRLGESANGHSASAASSRLRYWHKLRQVWLMPSAWTKSRNWSLRWLITPLQEGADWLNKYFANLFSRG